MHLILSSLETFVGSGRHGLCKTPALVFYVGDSLTDVNPYSLEFDLLSTLILSGSSQVRPFGLLNVSDSIGMAQTITFPLSMLRYGDAHGGKLSFSMAILQNSLERGSQVGWQNSIRRYPETSATAT